MPVIEVEDVSMMFRLSRGREVRVKEYLLNLARGRLSYEEFWALRNVSFRLEPMVRENLLCSSSLPELCALPVGRSGYRGPLRP